MWLSACAQQFTTEVDRYPIVGCVQSSVIFMALGLVGLTILREVVVRVGARRG